MRLQISDLRFQIPGIVLAAALLAGCSTARPAHKTDPEIARLAGAARMAFERGSAEQAARLYSRALEKARAQDDAIESGNNAYNLASCRIALGQYDEARALLEEAQREFERAGRDASYLILSQADLARRTDRAGDANNLLDRLSSRKGGLSGELAVRVAVRKVLLACDAGKADKAQAELASAQRDVKGLKDDFLQAEVLGASARVALLAGKPARAAADYDAQAEAFRKAGKFGEMASALQRAGRAYEAAGVLLMAGDRYYRTARSLFGQGDDLGALKMIEHALGVAEKTGDQALVQRTAALFKEIKDKVKETSSAPAANP